MEKQNNPVPIPWYAWVIVGILLIVLIIIQQGICNEYSILNEKINYENLFYSIVFSILFLITFFGLFWLSIFVITQIYYKKGLNVFTHQYFRSERIILILTTLLMIIMFLLNPSLEFSSSIINIYELIFLSYYFLYNFCCTVFGYRREKNYLRFNPNYSGKDSIRWL